MKVDLIKDPGEREPRRRGTLSAVVARLSLLRAPFPAASNGLLSILDQGIVSGTAFATAAIIGRTTSPEQLGLYYLLLTIVLVVLGIQEQVVAAPYIVYSKRRQGRELAEYGGSMWLHHAVLTVLTVAGLGVAIIAISATGNTAIRPGMWALLGAAPLLMLREGVRRFAFANLHLRSALAVDFTVAIAQLCGLGLLATFGALTLFGIYGVMAGACALACVGWYALDPPHTHVNRQRLSTDWRNNWSFGKWALRSYLVGNTTPYVMLWVLGLAVGAAATGVLGACTTLVGIANVFLLGVSNVLTPQAAHEFAANGSAALRRILLRTASFLALAMGTLCLVMLVTGDMIAVWVYGSEYEGCGAILVTLAFSMLMTGMNIVAGNGLWAIDRPRANFVADVCCMTVTLVAAALLVFSFGALGAALATLAGTSTAALVRTFTLARALDSGDLASGVTCNPALSS